MTQNNATTTTNIKTRFLICSDTHGLDSLPGFIPSAKQHADVAIHCGDLTTQSQLHEYKASIRLLQAIDAPLKLVIAGNHDFTMDIPMFHKKVADAKSLERELVEQAYGYDGEARRLFEGTGITFLDEGSIHAFTWRLGFQYHPDKGHDFMIDNGSGTNTVDVVMTHGPPKGIMDYTHSGERAGSPDLFRALARARPQMHCFGHIHEGWGAKLVTWRDRTTAMPSHLTDIDNGQSYPIAKLSDMKDRAEQSLSGDSAPMKYFATSHCSGDAHPLNWGSQTLFVNAAIEGTPQGIYNQKENLSMQLPWAVDLELRSSA
ncbi:hypothetical protein N7497_007613 [Penicillium chrysogenum]|uniref:Calcineurin-like phosphoesterase domain-containing protein n=1 Tax=Penicillium chrysogenum TaxID=5076 RepID=A0ABQ8W413_PENCH|nr:hypothetical protein N7505_010062 [Penicillium chrysogenum]KAJ6153294.1 hypothetical protein N7497_007613 [Penicillium chrysogenum]